MIIWGYQHKDLFGNSWQVAQFSSDVFYIAYYLLRSDKTEMAEQSILQWS